MDDDVGRFLLDLYRAGREIPYPGFKDWVFEQLGGLIGFDSAWWGSGSERPLNVHRVALFRCDPAILEAYPQFIEVDFFRDAVSRHPGKAMLFSDLMDRPSFEQTKIYREFGRRFKVEWSMGVVLIEPVSSLNEFITVWRHDAGDPFHEDDRRRFQCVVPHLFEANRAARVHHLREPQSAGRRVAWALCDEKGVLQDLVPAFVDLMREEWRSWSGATLPEPLIRAVGHGRRFVGRRLVIDAQSHGGLLLLEARWRSSLDELTAREAEVAMAFARGETHTEVASRLGISPATVRNQIYRAYRKLHVNNKAELVMRLFDLRRASAPGAHGPDRNPRR